MRNFSICKRFVSVVLIASLLFSFFGVFPASADTPSKVTLVGNLQDELGHTGDWDPAATVTDMVYDRLHGYHTFTGVLGPGTYEYKVALNGTWDVNYGFESYTNPGGTGNNGNIQITLPAMTSVTFYYHPETHKIADSTYYTPISADKLPRIVGDLQTEIGDASDWSPADATLLLTDTDFDNVYTATKTVPAGNYQFKVILGTSRDNDDSYPAMNQSLNLPQDLPVTFTYNASDHSVNASFTVPQDLKPVPDGHLRIHYQRTDGDYEPYGVWLWGDVEAPSQNWPSGATPFPAGQADSYGAYVDIPLKADAKSVGFLIVNRSQGDKDGGDKTFTLTTPEMNEVFVRQGDNTVYPYEPVDLPANTLRIHYVRNDGNYGNYGAWLWDDVAEPSVNWPSGASPFAGTDRYGVYADIALKENAKKIGFLIVDRILGDAGKDGGDKSFAFLDKYNQVWVRTGDNNVYISPYWELPVGLIAAEVLSEGKVLLNFSTTEGLNAETLKNELSIQDRSGNPVPIHDVAVTGESTVEVYVNLTLDQVPLSITYAGKTVSAASGWRMLDELYAYNGNDLGAVYQSGDVTFKLWAPTASSVVVNVYGKEDPTKWIGSANLAKGAHGVWSAQVTAESLGVADLRGYYYQYEVTNNGVTKRVLDPYAKSMAPFRVDTTGAPGPDGDTVGKAAIVDLSGTDPEGFDFADIEGYEKREDAVIWEVHVRDFTSDPSIDGDLNGKTWGTFEAFKQKLDYIKSLGVTHVQLLPVMAWYYGDELNMKTRELKYSARNNEYNWGYDPHNYFSPDGAYSEDPTDPELRIRELKSLIDAIHDAGMGVILDVVYTHMAKADFLNDIVPNYYFFQDANGNFIGGFGNNLATSHKMAEKLMIDSVKYWFEEYKIDGMRFDMMGDATYESIQNAYNAAAAINPNALFIGEGWRTFSGHLSDPSLAGKGADQDWMDKTDDVAVFSDEIRNELKSGFGSEGEPRFITGGARNIQTIFNNIKGQPSNTRHDDPGDMVQYIAAHDNLTLHDVIAQSIKKDPAVPANEEEIHKRIRLGNALILTSQGIAFLHAGQEHGRTKQWLDTGVPEQKYHELKDENGQPFVHPYFIHDSYDSSDAINKFDWTRATDAGLYPVNNLTRAYTAGLIELRKSSEAFRLGDKALVDSNVRLIDAPEIGENDKIIAYMSKSTGGSGHFYVFVNADDVSRKVTLSENLTGATVVVDNDEAGATAVDDPTGFTLTANAITLEPLTAVVLRKDSERTESGTTPGSGTGTGSDNSQIISEDALNKGENGKVVIPVDKETVLLPLDAARMLAGNQLELKSGAISLGLPSELLAAVQKKASESGMENGRIALTFAPLSKEETVQLVQPLNTEHTDVKPASAAYEFTLSIIAPDGRTIPVAEFDHPIVLAIEFADDANEDLLGIYFVGDDGKLEYIGGTVIGNVITAEIRHFSKYAALEYTKTFGDVSAKHWAFGKIQALAAKHILSGVSDTRFEPARNMTRAEFVSALVRALGISPEGKSEYADVPDDAWYSSYVATASRLGIVQGRGASRFAPDDPISREEMAIMIVRAYETKTGQKVTPAAKKSSFADRGAISAWAVPHVDTAAKIGLIQGRGNGQFAPKDFMTRAESAQILYALLKP